MKKILKLSICNYSSWEYEAKNFK